MDDIEYDVLPSTQCDLELPPLPPKKTGSKSSFHKVEGLSRMSPTQEARPKPMPRTHIARRSSIGQDCLVSPTSSDERPSPTDTSKPVPRPRARKSNSIQLGEAGTNSPPLMNEVVESSQSPVDEISWSGNLPPSADEVEDMVNRMVMEEQQAAERKLKEESQNTLLSSPLEVGVISSLNDSSSQGQPASSPATNCLGNVHSNHQTISEVSSANHGSNLTMNGSVIKGNLTQDLPAFQSESEKSDADVFQIPKLPETKLPVVSTDMLMPTKLWNNDSVPKFNGPSVHPPTEVLGEDNNDEEEREEVYEAVWVDKPVKHPGMVRPISNLMAFTPKLEDSFPSERFLYGERSGEYIGLDPTYNIPPPDLPPPPLPDLKFVRICRPPSIPPRPPYKNPMGALHSDKFTFNSSTHMTESSSDGPVEGSPSAAFEKLETPKFTPFSDDPFRYSGFDSECQKFNRPVGNDLPGVSADQDFAIFDEQIYEDRNDIWPRPFEESTKASVYNMYEQIEDENRPEMSKRHEVRMSQVPPPPPRLTRPGQVLQHGESPPSRQNLYSVEAEEDTSLGSIDSDADDPFCPISPSSEQQNTLPRTRSDVVCGGVSIIPGPLSPRKNERYGYLYKQGGVKANKGWKLRWVVFNGRDLRYYDSNKSQISKKIIPLSSMKEVINDIKEGDTTKFKFRLMTTLKGRIFVFAADARDDCCMWTNTLMADILANNSGKQVNELRKADKEGFVRFENNNRKYYVAIWGKILCYYDTFEDFQMDCPVHEIEMKLASIKEKKKNKLQLSTHYAHFM